MRSRGIIGFVLAVLLLPALTSAQTDTSLRIRSLGSSFEGLLDDYLTDVYLNPARTAELSGPMVYVVRLVPRTIASPFPVARLNYSGSYWTENQYHRYGISPIGLSYFGTLGESLAWSLGTEIDVNSSEDFRDWYDISAWNDEANLRQWSEGSTSTIQHYVVDLSVASRSNPLGGRITAAYDSDDFGNVYVSETISVLTSDLENLRSDYRSRYSQGKMERLVVSASLGLFMPGRWARDLVIGGGFIEEKLSVDQRETDINDYDADGNGDWYDNRVRYSRDMDTYVSRRDYTGYNAFARAHLEWSDRIRSVHAGGWSRSTGDGHASLGAETRRFDSMTDFSSDTQMEYGYGGSVDRFSLESSVGYSEVFFGDVLFAFAFHGVYRRTTFDEPADGTVWGENSEAGASYSSPYFQKHDNTDDYLSLSVPVGVEWQLHKYVALRLGATFFAQRSKTERNLTGDVDELSNGELLLIPGAWNTQYLNVDSDVDVRFTNGLEININERFILDFLSYASSINLAQYGHVSARFLF